MRIMEDSPFQMESQINIDLWPFGAWTQRELDQFIDIFQEYGSTTGQISSGIRGIEIQTLVAFATGAVAASFFSKLGSDVYDLAKTKLMALLLKRASGSTTTPKPEDFEGRVSFSYNWVESGLREVYYGCRYSQEYELDACLSSISGLDSMVRSACESHLFPFDKGQSFDIYAELETTQQPIWRVRIRRYSEVDGKLSLNEFFKVDFDCEKTSRLGWNSLNWTQQRLP